MYKINIGCENQIISNWENLDNRADKFPGAKYWSWNEPLPYPDNSAEIILIQHSLMYCSKENYNKNLQELYRVLSPNSKMILKEENNKKYQWRKLGTKHKTGHIIGSTNPEEIVPILEKNGFKIISQDPKSIVEKYPNIINRLPKLFKGKLFVIECQKVV